VLNRLAYGPRPGETDAMASAGVDHWIAAQLDPASLDDAEVDAKLRALPTLTMTSAELHEHYPRPKKAKPELTMGRPKEVARELAVQRTLRAVTSRRQLQEVLVDFWFNHFNVYADKGQDKWLLVSYERDAIRPHVFGSFRDLLGATARHPAMLFYLDNWLSVAPQADAAPPATATAPKQGKRSKGLNENYARELLELHTLGVDGGYTQDDVRETARAFTGWTIDHPQGVAEFVFRPRKHDRGDKTVLGHLLQAGGMRDGEEVLDVVAAHPSTARFIAKKLCRKFVADAPPDDLVERVAETFSRTHGDLKSVYEAIFIAPEFWTDAAFASKVKTPFELAASALRAVGATLSEDVDLGPQLTRMGEPLYRAQPPTGYKESADAWVNTGSLVARLNFGLALASGRLPGVRFDAEKLLGTELPADPAAMVDRLAAVLVDRPLATSTRDTIVAGLAAAGSGLPYEERAPEQLSRAMGLLLGSPEFQKQ
jgi:uncharacterized protein (DUF1800 family)